MTCLVLWPTGRNRSMWIQNYNAKIIQLLLWASFLKSFDFNYWKTLKVILLFILVWLLRKSFMLIKIHRFAQHHCLLTLQTFDNKWNQICCQFLNLENQFITSGVIYLTFDISQPTQCGLNSTSSKAHESITNSERLRLAGETGNDVLKYEKFMWFGMKTRQYLWTK